MDDYRAAMIAEGAIVSATWEQYLDAWQHLVDSGLAWCLQGWFGRMARDLMSAGLIAPPCPCPRTQEDVIAEKERKLEGHTMFTDDNMIFAYSRAQAIADGVLVDAGEMAKEAGFRIPVALTRTVWDQYVAVPQGVEGQDERGRLWDVLVMLRFAISRDRSRSELRFQLHVRNDNREDDDPPLVTLKAVCGPNDDGTPCITVMNVDED
jgi:hypothetical protein